MNGDSLSNPEVTIEENSDENLYELEDPPLSKGHVKKLTRGDLVETRKLYDDGIPFRYTWDSHDRAYFNYPRGKFTRANFPGH